MIAILVVLLTNVMAFAQESETDDNINQVVEENSEVDSDNNTSIDETQSRINYREW